MRNKNRKDDLEEGRTSRCGSDGNDDDADNFDDERSTGSMRGCGLNSCTPNDEPCLKDEWNMRALYFLFFCMFAASVSLLVACCHCTFVMLTTSVSEFPKTVAFGLWYQAFYDYEDDAHFRGCISYNYKYTIFSGMVDKSRYLGAISAGLATITFLLVMSLVMFVGTEGWKRTILLLIRILNPVAFIAGAFTFGIFTLATCHQEDASCKPGVAGWIAIFGVFLLLVASVLGFFVTVPPTPMFIPAWLVEEEKKERAKSVSASSSTSSESNPPAESRIVKYKKPASDETQIVEYNSETNISVADSKESEEFSTQVTDLVPIQRAAARSAGATAINDISERSERSHSSVGTETGPRGMIVASPSPPASPRRSVAPPPPGSPRRSAAYGASPLAPRSPRRSSGGGVPVISPPSNPRRYSAPMSDNCERSRSALPQQPRPGSPRRSAAAGIPSQPQPMTPSSPRRSTATGIPSQPLPISPSSPRRSTATGIPSQPMPMSPSSPRRSTAKGIPSQPLPMSPRSPQKSVTESPRMKGSFEKSPKKKKDKATTDSAEKSHKKKDKKKKDKEKAVNDGSEKSPSKKKKKNRKSGTDDEAPASPMEKSNTTSGKVKGIASQLPPPPEPASPSKEKRKSSKSKG